MSICKEATNLRKKWISDNSGGFYAIFAAKTALIMINVAIVAGGDSGEYGISVKSGKQVELHIDRSLFRPFLINIRGKQWYYRIGQKSFPVDKNDFSLTIGHKKVRFDIVFNAIHGTPGENGRLQGYLDMLGIPYTSCDVATSAVTFNKSLCKSAVAAGGVSLARSRLVRAGDHDPAGLITTAMKFPLFVKPNNGGSSVGMSKVNAPEGLQEALRRAFREDGEVLVEEFIGGRELTCGVILTGGEVIALPLTEIIPKKEYFDYEAKYKPGMAMEEVPANIPGAVADECRRVSVSLFRLLNCRGVVRFDYIYDGREFWFLEVNTVPGLTRASIVPNMARAYGWNFTELITRMIRG